MLLCKVHTWWKSDYWDMGQNALGQSDCRIFKSTISLEKMDETARCFYTDTNSWKFKVALKYFE